MIDDKGNYLRDEVMAKEPVQVGRVARDVLEGLLSGNRTEYVERMNRIEVARRKLNRIYEERN